MTWTLKAWWALLLPTPGGGGETGRASGGTPAGFKAFDHLRLLPGRRTGRKTVLRILGWNPHLMTFFRLLTRLRT